MGVRKTIYVPDGIWEKVGLEAEKCGLSISQMLLQPWVQDNEQLDRMEGKLDELLDRGISGKNIKRALSAVSHSFDAVGKDVVEPPKKIKPGAPIVVDADFFNPQPKDKKPKDKKSKGKNK